MRLLIFLLFSIVWTFSDLRKFTMTQDYFKVELGYELTSPNSQSGPRWLQGSAAPGGEAITDDAPIGSFYTRTNGQFYTKVANTGSASDWEEKTSSGPTSFSWRSELVRAATADTLSAGAGQDPTSWSDNESGLDATNWNIGDYILSDVDGTPALFEITGKDSSTSITLTAASKALADKDTFIVQAYLPDSPASQEQQSIIHFPDATLSAIKISDFNWEFATGINLSSGYAASSGDIADSDTVESAIQKLDGNNDAQDSVLGTDQGATDFGSFSGTSFADGQDAKQLFQRVETLLEQMRGVRVSGITTAATVDSVLHADVKACKWMVEAFEDATPANRKAFEVYALTDGGGGGESTAPAIPAAPALPGSYDHTVGSGGSFATLEAALADASVSDGDSIQVLDGTYLVTSSIAVDKQVKIYGQSKAGVIFETAGDTSDPVNMFNISVDNVLMKDMTIKHKKTSNTSVENAIGVSGPGFPQTRVANFVIDNCRIEHVEFALVIRGSDWQLRNCQFVYEGPSNSTRRHVGVYGTLGNCFMYQCESEDNGATGNTRWLVPTSTTGSNPNETMEGNLVLDGNVQTVGNLQQFYSQDNWQGSAGGFALFVKGNTTNESSAFVSMYGGTANFADILSKVEVTGNSLSNTHGGDPVGGKGVIGFDGFGGVSPRSTALPVDSGNNTLANLDFRGGYLEATGSSGSIVGYNSANLVDFSVALASVGGTSVVNTVYSKLEVGSAFDLTTTVDVEGSEMRLRAESSTAGVTVTARRIEVVSTAA
jgi:hypothetical protein